MRHLVDHRRLGRTSPHRKALFRNMATSLILHGRIHTTLPKAKELRKFADRLITWGKKGDVAARRHARRFVEDQTALNKLFNELAGRFASRNGGYTRIIKSNFRLGDQAPMAFIEYLDNPLPQLKSKGTGKEKPVEEKSKKSAKKSSKKKD